MSLRDRAVNAALRVAENNPATGLEVRAVERAAAVAASAAAASAASAAARAPPPVYSAPAQYPATQSPQRSSSGGGVNFGEWFVVGLILFFHILDWSMGYVSAWNLVYSLYVILAFIMALIATFRANIAFIGFFKYLARYLFICALGALIPRVIKFGITYMPQTLSDMAFFLLLLFPVILMIYTFDPTLGASHGLKKFMIIWLTIWMLIFTVIGLFSVTLPTGTFDSVDTELSAKNSVNFIMDGFTNVFDNLKFTWGTSINVSKWDPFYYTGSVEQNKDRPLGVALEDTQATDPYFVPGSAPTLWSYVTAETFLTDSIKVEPFCIIDRKRPGTTYPEGVVEPQVLEVFRGHSEQFECRFPGVFEKGSYPVEVSASFDFSTWGDITYEFVLEDKVRDYARLEKNVNSELKIPVEPTAVFTNGPIMIGMGGSRLPVLVTSEPPYLKNAYLGFTLQSRWPSGALNEVYTLELKVPRGFILSDCDRRDGKVIGPSEDPNVPEYDRYIFENVAGPAVPFTSVRCKLGLESPAVLEDLYLGADKALRTFIASTDYRYTITDKSSFEVKE